MTSNKKQSLEDIAVEASKTEEVPTIDCVLESGATFQMSEADMIKHLKDDFSLAAGEHEQTSEQMKQVTAVYQSWCYSFIKRLYKENVNASNKAILSRYDVGLARIEELAFLSSKKSDDNYSAVYASRKSSVRTCITKVGNPHKIKWGEGVKDNVNSYMKLNKKKLTPIEVECNTAKERMQQLNALIKKSGSKKLSDKELRKLALVVVDVSAIDVEIKKIHDHIADVAQANDVVEKAQGK
tara:strand:+ start:246 stop:965 length:720 start_codon:yes stop_codon:yes gene_type:complete